MARVTVEDCLQHVDNRFELVVVSAKRARQLSFGAHSLLPDDQSTLPLWRRDKPTVVALKEIEAGLVREDNVNELGAAMEAQSPVEIAMANLAEEIVPSIQIETGEVVTPEKGAEPATEQKAAAPEEAAPEKTAPEKGAESATEETTSEETPSEETAASKQASDLQSPDDA